MVATNIKVATSIYHGLSGMLVATSMMVATITDLYATRVDATTTSTRSYHHMGRSLLEVVATILGLYATIVVATIKKGATSIPGRPLLRLLATFIGLYATMW